MVFKVVYFRLFGYASYFYPFILLYPVYALYKSAKFNLKTAGNIVGGIVLFYSFLLFCSMFEPMAGGVIGAVICAYLSGSLIAAKNVRAIIFLRS